MVFTNDSKFELNLLIDKKSQKVLLAGVKKDVVDFFVSLMSLPIGSLAQLITGESASGPLCKTYRSWEKLDNSFLSSTQMTANGLIPVNSPTPSSNFALLLSSSSPATALKEKVYICNCKCIFVFSDVNETFCSYCEYQYHYWALSYVGPSVTKEAIERDGYVKDGITYAVIDDLSMVPVTSPLASIELLNKMGCKDLKLLEKKTVSLDVQQDFELLKTSFRSKNVLTDMFLAKNK